MIESILNRINKDDKFAIVIDRSNNLELLKYETLEEIREDYKRLYQTIPVGIYAIEVLEDGKKIRFITHLF